ncbi:hypothetical protein HMPREF3169_03210 [Corynebacterium sp. HMSC08C04]|uniref:GAP1-N2 domain-containing protein n=1 Tax=Corynebacterium TaxID=1716 RepID=UPI0008A14977|nr:MULTISPECIES: hypothetical protein [Corynebacterium]MCG7248188.1 hypothetical protein [Corynebacterium simulans]OFM04001.1 hypothetical protein HMPREF2724_01830 [Corynebacterium sp. HMSC071F07]OFT35271.1 hypothetical protein HMPREF3169_03210 [Corynebacterium sp. HMSC08C04]
MAGAFSFASFSRGNGRAGGWGVGAVSGDISQEQLQELVSFVPTSLNSGAPIPDFPSAQERAELVRRTAVFTLTEEGEQWVTMVSVPAGIDATGRGGNVFTYTAVSDGGVPPAPADVLYSPDVPTPFSIFEVDKVEIPEKISRKGPLASDALIDDFLAGEFRSPAALPTPFKSVVPHNDAAYNARLVEAMAKVLSSKKKTLVILVAPENQAAFWVAAAAREVGEPGFGFSTFEKPAAIAELPLGTSTMVVVPESEKLRLFELTKARAIPGNPVIFELGEPLPDLSAYEGAGEVASAPTPAPEAVEPEASSPFVDEPAQSVAEPWAESPAAAAADLSAASQVNPFSESAQSAPRGEENGASPGIAQTEPAPTAAAAAAPAAPGANAVVPGLTSDELEQLRDFDPAWWMGYLKKHRGRAIHFALLHPSCFPEGTRVFALAAALASWVKYFPADYNFLVSQALGGIDTASLDQARALTIERFAPVIQLEERRSAATGELGRYLGGIFAEIKRAHGFTES